MTRRLPYVLAALSLLASAGTGCARRCGEGVTHGDGITVVQLRLGMPDVISDAAGDMERFYTPHDRPPEEWPGSAPRTFYYLDRDLRVTFLRGKVTACGRIDPERKRTVLVPLARGEAGPGRTR
jgi:hypothetical protein